MRQTTFRVTSVLIIFLSLAGCQTTNQTTASHPYELLNQPQFRSMPVESQKEIFALDPDIRSNLDRLFGDEDGSVMRAKQLMAFLMKNGDNAMSYQSGANLTASETFRNLNANCLSLSILAHSMSEYVGLKSQFQRVMIPEFWDQSHGYSLLTGHVNLKVSQKRLRNNGYYSYSLTEPDSLIVDFDPNSRQQHFKTEYITKDRITAMFYNNKGAIALIERNYDQAFSYMKAAIELDPEYSSSWGNLGVLLRASGAMESAEKAYDHAYELDNNVTALGNLAILYRMTARENKAANIESRLEQRRAANPYYQIMLGNEAFESHDLNGALAHYRKARTLDPQLHFSYFGIAKVYYMLGDSSKARENLEAAYKLADYDHDKLKYTNKLRWLNAVVKN